MSESILHIINYSNTQELLPHTKHALTFGLIG